MCSGDRSSGLLLPNASFVSYSSCSQAALKALSNHFNFYRNSSIKNLQLFFMSSDRTNTIQSCFPHRKLNFMLIFLVVPILDAELCRSITIMPLTEAMQSSQHKTSAFKNSQHGFVSILFFLLLFLGLVCSCPLLSQSVFTFPPHHPQLSQ